jgi:molecular chaperone DnaJ
MAAQREWFETDYYSVLGVRPEATAKEITRAYRKLARELHPDKNPGDASAEDRFKSVSSAYDVLGDEGRRAEYDEVRRLGPMAGGVGAGGFSFNAGDVGGFGDLFGQMFNSGHQRSTAGPRRGADQAARLTLSFYDAAKGVTTSLNVTSEGRCETCSGSGARPGSDPRICGVCGGRGAVDENQGPFSFSSPCRSCSGHGRIIDNPCSTCGGSGATVGHRSVQVRIPPGVSDGKTIRVKGRGAPGRNGGPSGDLLVELTVQPHEVFTRNGMNLEVTLPVQFAELALGSEVAVPTLEGDMVRLRLQPGTQSGSRHRVSGRGIESTTRGTTSRGDLIVRVAVQVPTSLTDEQREAIERLAGVLTDNPRAHTVYDGSAS